MYIGGPKDETKTKCLQRVENFFAFVAIMRVIQIADSEKLRSISAQTERVGILQAGFVFKFDEIIFRNIALPSRIFCQKMAHHNFITKIKLIRYFIKWDKNF